MKYELTRPCAKCPFRSDIPSYISPARVREIEYTLDRGEFPCHETCDYDHEDEDGMPFGRETEQSQHCAGALILLEKEERPSQMMRIMERLRMYDRTKLDMSAPVHDTFDAMVDHCFVPRKRRRKQKHSSASKHPKG